MSPNLAVILNWFSEVIHKKLVQLMLPEIARSKFAAHYISIVMKSFAFQSLFFEEVKSTGLTH